MHWATCTLRHVAASALEEAERMQLLLSIAIGGQESVSDWVNVAGSSALHWFQLSEGLCGPDTSKHWSPNDIDIFCCNAIARTDDGFARYVNDSIARIVSFGCTVERVTQYKNRYIDDEEEVMVVRVKLCHVDTALSFVQRPNHNTVTEVMEEFDINVCKVLYRVHGRDSDGGGALEVRPSIGNAIRAREASCKTFRFRSHTPTCLEIDKLECTLFRMQKYAKRGFFFVNYPRIQSEQP